MTTADKVQIFRFTRVPFIHRFDCIYKL